ncbi:hypothetical protein ILYODFUR_023920 [Ilyodon furcidens]|uniref:Uncharacterized protein n=1 Tax=Ilyodon furcidens TaxID=33524 RepID=A0ABV0ULI9_9TELE
MQPAAKESGPTLYCSEQRPGPPEPLTVLQTREISWSIFGHYDTAESLQFSGNVARKDKSVERRQTDRQKPTGDS